MAYKTRQRDLILGYIKENSDKHLTAEEITDALKAEGVGKTTVYRYLEKLCGEGLVRKYILSDGKSACFQFSDGEECSSHFHLKCLKCGGLTHLECDYLSELERHITAHHDFLIDSSRTVFYGVCRACGEQA